MKGRPCGFGWRPNFRVKLVWLRPAAELPRSSPTRWRHGGCGLPLSAPFAASSRPLIFVTHNESLSRRQGSFMLYSLVYDAVVREAKERYASQTVAYPQLEELTIAVQLICATEVRTETRRRQCVLEDGSWPTSLERRVRRCEDN